MRKKHKPLRPPVRDGISPHALFLPVASPACVTVLAYLAQRFPAVGEQQWQQRMARGRVLDAAGQPLPPEAPYRPGTRLYYYRECERETPVPFAEQILFEDEHLLVADKPHFLPVAPSGEYLHETLLTRLRQRTGCTDLVVLHRIDRDTAGLVLLSKNPASRAAYHALFRTRQIRKLYEAIAPPAPALTFPLTRSSRIERAADFWRRQEVAGPANALTHIDCLDTGGSLARYRLEPVTGKTHQLRVHMSALGLPILNDGYYPQDLGRARDDFSRPLQLLARTLLFTDPLTGHPRRFDSRFLLAAP